MKKIISLICVLCLTLSLLIPIAFAEDGGNVLTLDHSTLLCKFIQETWPKGEIRIGKAVLETGNGSRDIYLVTVRGIDWGEVSPNGLGAYFRLLGNNSCEYYEIVKNNINKYVPEGSAIVAAGHSLGGMVVQRLICDDDLTAKYEFVSSVTFGSPYVVTAKTKREGGLARLEDKSDIVPKFSLAMISSPADYRGGTRRDGGYTGNLLDAHNVSYQASSVWSAFDVLGAEGGSAVIRLPLDSLLTINI